MTTTAARPSAVRPALPPGPPFRRSLPAFLRDSDAFLRRQRDRYGHVWAWQGRIPELGDVVMVTDASLMTPLFRAPADEVDSTEGQRPLEPIYGPRSLFLVDGPQHRRLRKLMLPKFRGTALEEYARTVDEVTVDVVRRWPVDRPVELKPHAHDVTLDVILRIVMGLDDEATRDRWRAPMSRLLVLSMSERAFVRYGLRRFGALDRWRSFQRTLSACDALVLDEVARRRASGEERDDVLGLLLRSTDVDENPLDDAEIRDQLMTMLVAGHETTATATCWAVERLLRHPRALARVVAEADRTDGGDGRAYTDAVVAETLRLHPPIAFVARVTRQPFELGGHLLPAGTTVVPYLPLVQRDPAAFEDPEEFRPERFLGSPAAAATGWAPFGGGVHACLGNHFAGMQVRTMLHAMLRTVDLVPASPADEGARRRAIVNLPSRGARVVVKRFREQPAPAAA